MKYFNLRALGALTASLCLSATALAADVSALSFTPNGEQPVVTLSRTHGMVRGLIEKPLLYIFADGLVRVDRPAYMVRPGTYEFTLPREQLAQLIASMDDAGVLKLDAREVAAQRDAQARAHRDAAGVEYFTTDATVTQLEFDFGSFSRDGANPAALANRIAFADVQIEAGRFKNVAALAALADAERRLLALIDHPAMKATGGQAND